MQVTAVSARARKDRGVDLSNTQWFNDPAALARSPDVDLFVELMGGADGPAKAAVEAALQSGKPVVTANKALIATHGLHLARLAETHGAPLLYEAAVMGGVPAVKMLREGLTGEAVTSVAGILNGTCNFILSEMERTERGFAEVLSEAQKLGYAESDPYHGRRWFRRRAQDRHPRGAGVRRRAQSRRRADRGHRRRRADRHPPRPRPSATVSS